MLKVKLFGVEFKNPVWVASGTFGFALEGKKIYEPSKLGAIVLKGLSLKEREGNPPQRIVETPCGMLNTIGLQNPGLERFLKEIYPKIEKIGTNLIANIFGETLDEFVQVCKGLEDCKSIVAYELNVSCPNVEKGGIYFGHDKMALAKLISRVKGAVKKPVLVKLSPNVEDVREFARVCVEEGADGIVLINTLLGMKIDVRRKRPFLSKTFGGLSGPAILPVAVRMVYQVYESFGDKIPIVGVGGIYDTYSALEHILAGASAIQVGTANFFNPLSPLEIIKGLEEFLREEEFKSFKEIVGLAHKNAKT